MVRAARNDELEAAIISDPEDASTYQVYADWLLTHDDPRGELVLVQHALETSHGGEWTALKVREIELLSEHAEHFFGPVAPLPLHWHKCDWRRGFVDRMDGEFPTDEGERMISHPSLALVRALSDIELPAILDAAPPLLAELALGLGTPWAALHVPALRRLAISDVALPILLGASIAGDVEPDLSALESLSLATLPERRILERVDARRCERLGLVHADVSWWAPFDDDDADQIDALFDFVLAAPFARLDLALRRHDGDGEFPGAARIGRRELGRRVRSLRLHSPNRATLRRLSTAVPRLRALRLEEISDTTLAELPLAPRLTSLDIRDPLTQAMAAALVASPAASTIEHLSADLADAASARALGAGLLPRLRVLEIDWSTDLEPGDVSALADALPRLEEIAVHFVCLLELARSALAPRIQRLTLHGSRASLSGFLLLQTTRSAFSSLRAVRLTERTLLLTPAQIEILGSLSVPIELPPHLGPIAAPLWPEAELERAGD